MATIDLDPKIYVGLWTEWSMGAVMGRTLTVTRSDGNLLIAFTASFIAFVGARFWRIICVLCHRWCSSSNPDSQSTLHHQHQVTLRTSSSPDATAWVALEIILAWWKPGGKGGQGSWNSRRRLLALMGPVLVLSTLTWVGFPLAGGFSSNLATGNQATVLLESVDCGFMGTEIGDGAPDSLVAVSQAEIATRLNNAVDYAAQCYSTDSLGMVDCGRFAESRLPYSMDTNAPCPFGQEMCRNGDANNLRLDSGLITTNMLGLNLPTDQKSAVRTILECAPLVTEGYTNVVELDTNSSVVQYNYGPISMGTPGSNAYNPNYTEQAFTYQIEDVDSQYQWRQFPGRDFLDGLNLKLSYAWSMTKNHTKLIGTGTFKPIPSLERTDADLPIIFLSGNGVVFRDEWDDEWYRATRKTTMYLADDTDPRVIYQPEEAALPLGCIQKYQFCNLAEPKGAQCGPLASLNDAMDEAGPYFNSTLWPGIPDETTLGSNRDATRLYWLAMMTGSDSISIMNLLSYMGSKALTSQKWLLSGQQSIIPGSIPQWQSDVKSWFDSCLAHLQLEAVYTPIGPAIAEANDTRLRMRAEGTYQQSLCESQMIRSSNYTSFSVFGLAFTYALRCLIIITSMILERLLLFLYRYNGFQAYKFLEWTMNSTLQLHRHAHEEVGYGEWSGCDGVVPTTEHNTLLGPLDMNDRKHPRIGRLGATRASSMSGNTYTGSEKKQTWKQQVVSVDSLDSDTVSPVSPSSATRSKPSIRRGALQEDGDVILPISPTGDCEVGSERAKGAPSPRTVDENGSRPLHSNYP